MKVLALVVGTGALSLISVLVILLTPLHSYFTQSRHTARFQHVLTLPTSGGVVAVAWSGDGSELAAASDYGETIDVWTSAGKLIRDIERDGGGPALSGDLSFLQGSRQILFSPPGIAPDSAALSLWDAKSGNLLGFIKDANPSKDNLENRARQFATSPDQSILVTGSTGVQNNVAVYQTKNWSLIHTIKIAQGSFALTVFGNGNLAAVGGVEGLVTVVNLKTGMQTNSFHAYQQSKYGQFLVGAVAGSPDGAYVLTGLGLATLWGVYANAPAARVWINSVIPVRITRVADGEVMAQIVGPKPPIHQAEWDQNGRFVAFVDDLDVLYICYPPPFEQPLQKIDLKDYGLSVAIAPDGQHLAVGVGNSVEVFQLQ